MYRFQKQQSSLVAISIVTAVVDSFPNGLSDEGIAVLEKCLEGAFHNLASDRMRASVTLEQFKDFVGMRALRKKPLLTEFINHALTRLNNNGYEVVDVSTGEPTRVSKDNVPDLVNSVIRSDNQILYAMKNSLPYGVFRFVPEDQMLKVISGDVANLITGE